MHSFWPAIIELRLQHCDVSLAAACKDALGRKANPITAKTALQVIYCCTQGNSYSAWQMSSRGTCYPGCLGPAGLLPGMHGLPSLA